MRYNSRKRAGSRRARDGGSFWLCYSDLMSALLLLFVLVLFYSVYQYHQMGETKSKELFEAAVALQAREDALKSQQILIEDKTAALSTALTDIEQKEDELSAAQMEAAAQKLLLDSQNEDLEKLRAALSQQEIDLNQALANYDAQQAVLAQQQTTLTQQQATLEKLVGVRADIIEELMRELSDANITGAKVDPSGAIVFDSEMMFDKNAAVLKDQGKTFLSRFIPNYLQVLMSDENTKYVSQIIIEGHTDTDGGFDMNMKLSQDRAYAVFSYLMSPEFTDVGSGAKERLRKIISVNGRAYSDPVFVDGAIDMDASRRVVIKFRLNDEDTVNAMIEVLRGINP